MKYAIYAWLKVHCTSGGVAVVTKWPDRPIAPHISFTLNECLGIELIQIRSSLKGCGFLLLNFVLPINWFDD